MRVWTKPELIVDTMELSQAYAAGCDLKKKDNDTSHWKVGKNKNFYVEWYLSYTSDPSLETIAAYEEPTNKLTESDVLLAAREIDQNYTDVMVRGDIGVLYNS